MELDLQIKTIKQDNLSFLLNEKEKTASIIQGYSASGDLIIPRCIKFNSQEFIIKEIKNDAFKFSSRIKSIKFAPDTELQTIGKHTFAGSTVRSISIPSCVSELSNGWCDGIQRFTKVTVMECKTQNLIFYENKIIIGKSDSKSDQYDILYYAQRDIKEITIPLSVKIISSYAFSNSQIQSITISPHITKFCECAFACCYNLRRFEVQENSELEIIGKHSFAGSEIESFIIPSSIVEFNEGWCEGMQFLTKIKVFKNKDQNISYYNDEYIIRKSDLKSDIFDVIIFARRDLKNSIIPSFIKKIESHSFEFTSLESIDIPPQITHICDFSFSSCSKLQKVDFNSNSKLQEIGKHAFSYTSLRSFLIPSNVKQIGDEIFSHCKSLQIIEVSENINANLIDKLLINEDCKNIIIMIPSNLKFSKD